MGVKASWMGAAMVVKEDGSRRGVSSGAAGCIVEEGVVVRRECMKSLRVEQMISRVGLFPLLVLSLFLRRNWRK